MEPHRTPYVQFDQRHLGRATTGELRKGAQIYPDDSFCHRLSVHGPLGQESLRNRRCRLTRSSNGVTLTQPQDVPPLELHPSSSCHRTLSKLTKLPFYSS